MNHYTQYNPVIISVTFRDKTGTLYDPGTVKFAAVSTGSPTETVSATWTLAGGDPSGTITHGTTGTFTASLYLDQGGEWSYSMYDAGTGGPSGSNVLYCDAGGPR